MQDLRRTFDGVPESQSGLITCSGIVSDGSYLSLWEILLSSLVLVEKEKSLVVNLNVLHWLTAVMLLEGVAEHLTGLLENTAHWECHASENSLSPEIVVLFIDTMIQ